MSFHLLPTTSANDDDDDDGCDNDDCARDNLVKDDERFIKTFAPLLDKDPKVVDKVVKLLSSNNVLIDGTAAMRKLHPTLMEITTSFWKSLAPSGMINDHFFQWDAWTAQDKADVLSHDLMSVLEAMAGSIFSSMEPSVCEFVHLLMSTVAHLSF